MIKGETRMKYKSENLHKQETNIWNALMRNIVSCEKLKHKTQQNMLKHSEARPNGQASKIST